MREQLIFHIAESFDENTKAIIIPKSKRILKPCITPGILRCIRNINKMQLKLRTDPHNDTLKISFKRYRNYCNKLIKKLKRSYDRKQLENNLKKPKSLWNSKKQ